MHRIEILASMPVDWHAMLTPTTSLLELFIRGSCMYLTIFVIMRLFRRDQGSLNTADLLVLMMIADAAQNGMSAGYTSLPEGVILVSTIFFWNCVLDWLAFRFPFMHRLLQPPALALVINGRLQARNLRAEMLTREDLMEQLREQGVESLQQVKRCYLEGDGHISVIRAQGGDESKVRRESGGGADSA